MLEDKSLSAACENRADGKNVHLVRSWINHYACGCLLSEAADLKDEKEKWERSAKRAEIVLRQFIATGEIPRLPR